MATFLVLTVGTGTAGPHSNLVLGLKNTLGIVRPDSYWLVPSASPDSIAVAQLVRESQSAPFIPWDSTTPFRTIEHHDSIAHCRDAVASVLRHVRSLLQPGDRLVVNPTSGTKQMSAGATLAALDLEADEIQFTIGERADGVVRTGTERVESFDPTGIFLTRDFKIAAELSASGSHLAAHRLLAQHSAQEAKDAADVALCLHEWERQNYEAARQIAARSSDRALASARTPLQTLAEAAKTRKPHAAIVSDLLVTAGLQQRRGDQETALFLACKALESGLRLRLLQNTELHEPYSLQDLRSLPLPPQMIERLAMNSNDGATTILGLKLVVDILNNLGDPMAETYLADWRFSSFVGLRNEYTHALQPIAPAKAQAFLAIVQNLFSTHLHLPIPAARPTL